MKQEILLNLFGACLFSSNIHNRHFITSLRGPGMECPVWVHSLIYILHLCHSRLPLFLLSFSCFNCPAPSPQVTVTCASLSCYMHFMWTLHSTSHMAWLSPNYEILVLWNGRKCKHLSFGSLKIIQHIEDLNSLPQQTARTYLAHLAFIHSVAFSSGEVPDPLKLSSSGKTTGKSSKDTGTACTNPRWKM